MIDPQRASHQEKPTSPGRCYSMEVAMAAGLALALRRLEIVDQPEAVAGL
jgi:hypothetical protein